MTKVTAFDQLIVLLIAILLNLQSLYCNVYYRNKVVSKTGHFRHYYYQHHHHRGWRRPDRPAYDASVAFERVLEPQSMDRVAPVAVLNGVAKMVQVASNGRLLLREGDSIFTGPIAIFLIEVSHQAARRRAMVASLLDERGKGVRLAEKPIGRLRHTFRKLEAVPTLNHALESGEGKIQHAGHFVRPNLLESVAIVFFWCECTVERNHHQALEHADAKVSERRNAIAEEYRNNSVPEIKSRAMLSLAC